MALPIRGKTEKRFQNFLRIDEKPLRSERVSMVLELICPSSYNLQKFAHFELGKDRHVLFGKRIRLYDTRKYLKTGCLLVARLEAQLLFHRRAEAARRLASSKWSVGRGPYQTEFALRAHPDCGNCSNLRRAGLPRTSGRHCREVRVRARESARQA